MKTKMLTLAVATIALVLMPRARAENRGCSNSMLNGAYAYTSTGSIASPPIVAGPFVEVGVQDFDGKGDTTATATLSQNGNILQVSITGTYTLNPDCTGTMTLQVAPIGVTVHVYFALDSNGSAFQAIETDAGLVITRAGKKQFPGNGGQ